jgi:hypothetical protein
MIVPCIVISSGISERYSGLVNKLQDSRFLLTVVDGIIPIKIGEEFLLFNEFIETTKFQTYYGRKPLIGEIGCSAAHNKARKLASLNSQPTIIFEDDARILDLDALVKVYATFSIRQKGVLNLSYTSNKEKLNTNQEPHIYWVPTPAPLAVAYIVDPYSAEVLVTQNLNLDFVADWPDSKVKNYILDRAIVKHGDIQTSSTIDKIGIQQSRKIPRILLYIQIFTFYYYFRNRLNFENLSQYYRIFIKPRIFRHYFLFLKFVIKLRGS